MCKKKQKKKTHTHTHTPKIFEEGNFRFKQQMNFSRENKKNFHLKKKKKKKKFFQIKLSGWKYWHFFNFKF